MKFPRLCLACLFPIFFVGSAGAAVNIVRSWSGTLAIPDNDPSGASHSLEMVVTGTPEILGIMVQLEIEGGWNGDLYAYLVHNGHLTVLLNRPGRTATNLVGAGSSGMEVLFSDAAATDIHVALPNFGTPVATFQPDGRTSDPFDVLDTDPRPALLSVFDGEDANGTWTLFLADQGIGDTSTLKGWSLVVTVVPEPCSALLSGAGLMLLALTRRTGKATV